MRTLHFWPSLPLRLLFVLWADHPRGCQWRRASRHEIQPAAAIAANAIAMIAMYVPSRMRHPWPLRTSALRRRMWNMIQALTVLKPSSLAASLNSSRSVSESKRIDADGILGRFGIFFAIRLQYENGRFPSISDVILTWLARETYVIIMCAYSRPDVCNVPGCGNQFNGFGRSRRGPPTRLPRAAAHVRRLARDGGAHPNAVKAVMRRSTIVLTMDAYGHLFPGQVADTIARLPAMLLPVSVTRSALDAVQCVPVARGCENRTDSEPESKAIKPSKKARNASL